MIEIRLANIVTIVLCGWLGYALLIGAAKILGKNAGGLAGLYPGAASPNAS
jgi:hypothetical protein